MDDVFAEWDAYSLKQALRPRRVDFGGMQAASSLKIIAVTGIRRAGKSSILMLLRQKLGREGKKAAYVNVEDSRIKDEKDVLDGILKWFGDSGYLLLDEITAVRGWEGWLARNHEMLKGRLGLVVSSSRKSLAAPSRPLRGRVLPFEVYPLSFKEFLAFAGVEVEGTTAGAGRVEKALGDYLVYGGFPEAALVADKTDKIRLLNSYFKDIVGLDVAEASGQDVSAVELFAKYALEAPYFSASKCLNFFKSAGYKVGKQSLINLEKYSQSGYLFFFVPIFSYNIKDRSQYPRKAYPGDSGFLYAITGKKPLGRLYETAVFLELKRRLPPNSEISYWKNAQGFETDFVVREGLSAKEAIQVAYDLDDPKTKSRELRGLAACAKDFKLNAGTVITGGYQGSGAFDGIKIRFLPLWKWLLHAAPSK